jgi:hypothetical protein
VVLPGGEKLVAVAGGGSGDRYRRERRGWKVGDDDLWVGCDLIRFGSVRVKENGIGGGIWQ